MALTLSSQTGVLLGRSNSKLSGGCPPKRRVSISSSIQTPSKPYSLSFHAPRTPLSFIITTKQSPIRVRVSSSLSSQYPPTQSQSTLTGSTRTVTTIVTLAFTLSRLFLNSIQKFVANSSTLPNSTQLAAIRALQSNLIHSAGPLFFAAAKDRPDAYLNTPLTVVAAGLAKWLDIYSGVLMVRVLLSWFPNIPWDRQPLSAIRDLCDPYLNLFRNIIPPIFDTLDVSPLLAFAVLGTLGSILHSSGGGIY
ncbi:hypothetical protein M5689_018386 [Euphorbia peplus]|nr:hypothetical protein M5689_018386 [Euphorbia peplus]